MRNLLLGALLLSLAACTHHPVRVDCDKHLEAVNAAHPVLKADAAVKSP
jgi:hypothetical protein